MSQPDAQFRAGHIPAGLYRQIPEGTDPRHVIIVQAAPRNYTGPILLTISISLGSALVIVVLAVTVQIAAAAAAAALPAIGGAGITVKLAKKR